MLWFVSQDRKAEGPLSEQRIEQLIRWGKISARAYISDEQLTNWVPIQRTAFAPLLAQVTARAHAAAVPAPAFACLRGGPWRLTTCGAQRLSATLLALGVFAGALQLVDGLAKSHRLRAECVTEPVCSDAQRD
jgi:hypothetical protein